MAPAATRSRAPPGASSSAGWKRKRSSPPGRRSRASASTFAAPSSMAVWPSWPQACMTPGFSDAKSTPLASSIGRGSMSALSATTGPGRPVPSRPTTAFSAGRCTSRPSPKPASVSATYPAVSRSWKLSSGWRCRWRRHSTTRATTDSTPSSTPALPVSVMVELATPRAGRPVRARQALLGGDGAVARERARREDPYQRRDPDERDPAVGVRGRAEPVRAHGVGDRRERIDLGDLAQAVRHRLDRHEDRRGERQREDRGEPDRVRRLRRGREEPDQREDPRDRVAEQQAQREPGEDLREARVDEPEAGGEADREQHDERQAVERDVGDRAPEEHRRAGHRQRPEPGDQALLDVLGEAEGRDEAAEGD